MRSFGPRRLIEDNIVRSNASTIVSAWVGFRLSYSLAFGLEALNLFDSRSSDVDYFYASRLPGEAAARIEDIHFHPVEPFTLRATFAATSF